MPNNINQSGVLLFSAGDHEPPHILLPFCFRCIRHSFYIQSTLRPIHLFSLFHPVAFSCDHYPLPRDIPLFLFSPFLNVLCIGVRVVLLLLITLFYLSEEMGFYLSEEMGLTLNVKKTECMVISKKAIAPSCNLQSRGQQIKLVKKFKYLGYMITSDGKCITEIKKRIATAKDAFQKLSLILKNRNISMTTKFRVLKTYVWSTLTYGCECWTITSDIEKKIEAAEMWFIRRMLRISWTEKKPNVNVLREGNVQRSLLKTIRKRQVEFLGHVCRRRGLEFLSFTGKVEGNCDRGKQRITFLDSLCNSATGGQSKGLNFLKLSDDRDVWRGMAANVFQIWHPMMMMMTIQFPGERAVQREVVRN